MKECIKKTKEQFVAEPLIRLNNRVVVPFRDLNAQDYGVSRATAYRALSALRDANIINGDYGLTQPTRERLCEHCTCRKRCLKEDHKRHRETTRRFRSHI